MTVNIKNHQALKDYIARLVYHGGAVENFTPSQCKAPEYVRENKDRIIRAMTYQWMKKNVGEYLTNNEDAPFLERVTEADEDAPDWLKKDLSEGKPVYTFDETKVPDSFHADLQNINDYLYSSANNYLDKVLKQKNPSVSLDALKQRPEHKTFALTLEQAKKWHEEIARQAAERKIKEEEKQALEQGTEIVMELGDGFKAVRLLTPEALDKESDYMGHCVGKGGYDKGVKDGTIQIVSIRDKDGEPHATLEIRAADKTIRQCKGKANKTVVAKYIPYVQKFVSEQKLDPTNDLKSMGFCKDINGNIHSIYNIPEGTVFDNLDLSDMEITKLPDLSKCIVNKLDIHDCKFLTSLKGCPKEVKELNCSRCSSLTSLEGCSESVKEINCYGCESLTSLEGLSEGLEVIDCSRCSSLTSLEGCPESVKEINCNGCDSLTSLEGCPEGLKELNCSYCDSLISLKGLPTGLEKLDCRYTAITSLEGCPESLKELDFQECKSLTSLKGCPKEVKELNCSSCSSLTSLEGLPNGLEELDCRHTAITSLEGCPESLEKLNCNNCKSLISLKGCPKELKEFNCSCCYSLISLEGCPKGLEELNCLGCISLTSLKGCPEGLKRLICTRCHSLTSFEGCPKGLEELHCSDSDGLTSLKGCPEGLEKLNCTNCRSLASLEGLPEDLKELDCVNTAITSLEGCPESLGKIDCRYCDSLTSLEGCPRDVKEVNCNDCNNLKYIPDYISDEVIKGLSKEKIAECKANWLAKNKEEATKNKLGGIISSFRNTR